MPFEFGGFWNSFAFCHTCCGKEGKIVVSVSEITEFLKGPLKFEVICYSSILELGNCINIRL